MGNTIKKKTLGYGYKYTELADINKYCEENKIYYYQEVETCEINQKDYIVTYLKDEEGKIEKHRGCQIVDAILQGIKNPVQEYGSSLTYCRRYSLLMALGLATEDDDAKKCDIPNKKDNKEESIDRVKLMKDINELELDLDIPHEKVLDRLNVESLNQLTDSQLLKCVNDLKRVKK